ncbi:hypothetical protein EV121DRAFT_297738 [Schizophyllum commune]
MRQGPRRCPSLNAATVEVDADGRSRVFARRGAERRRHSTAKLTRNFANRRQLRRGPRGNPSLTAATWTLDHIREVEGLRDQQRGALLPSGSRRLYLLPSSLDSRCAIQKLILDLQRLLKGLSGSEAMYQRPASEDSTEIANTPPFSSFLSSETLTLLHATLFEPPAPLANPSILVSTDFNISQALGAEIT